MIIIEPNGLLLQGNGNPHWKHVAIRNAVYLFNTKVSMSPANKAEFIDICRSIAISMLQEGMLYF